jgi:hypothetical protein
MLDQLRKFDVGEFVQDRAACSARDFVEVFVTAGVAATGFPELLRSDIDESSSGQRVTDIVDAMPSSKLDIHQPWKGVEELAARVGCRAGQPGVLGRAVLDDHRPTRS